MAAMDVTVEIRSRRVWLVHLIPLADILPRSLYLRFAALVLRFVVVEMRYGKNEWQRLNLWSRLGAVADVEAEAGL